MKQLCLPTFVTLILAFGVPAVAQSTLTLESFSVTPDQEPSESIEPVERSGSDLENCLLDFTTCDNSEFRSGTSLSLEDVVNIGIIDREEVATSISSTSASAESTAAAMAEPLPSVDMEILFDYNSDAVRGDQMPQLAELADLLKSERFGDYRFLFLGHTDAKGSADYNRTLSARRAESVAALVRGLAGLPTDRIVASGMGFSQLKTPGDPLGSQNRRVQLVLLPR